MITVYGLTKESSKEPSLHKKNNDTKCIGQILNDKYIYNTFHVNSEELSLPDRNFSYYGILLFVLKKYKNNFYM